MVFAAVPFLFYFLPLFLAAYFVVPVHMRAGRNAVLVAGSLIFYAWGEGMVVLLLIASIMMNHVVGMLISAGRRWALAIGIVLNLLALAWFKYAGFAAQMVGIEVGSVHLPLGISFFTFQAISYLVDVWRKEASASETIMGTALYISSFPQLIAGPIVRYQTVAEAIVSRRETAEMMTAGIKLFILGLAQKVLFADLAAAPADAIFALSADELTPMIAWAGLGAYTLQIFFDFAGYSNMAMGLGLILGFQFPRNFSFPYAAQSITEFWRRWHITLSRWFRDYLYIPLGGSRQGHLRTITNLWIVFLLCGLWHGAAWTFILWGAWHGALLSIERLMGARALPTLLLPLTHLYTLVFVALGWVLFRADTGEGAVTFYRALFGHIGDAALPITLYFPGTTGLLLLVTALFATPLPAKGAQHFFGGAESTVPHLAAAQLIGFTLLLAASFSFIAGQTYSPFIYFRF